MAIGWILGIVFLLLFVAAIAGTGVFAFKEIKVGATFCGVGIVAFLILFICIPFSFYTVDAGEVAVVKHLGTISNVRMSGTYFDFWMTNKCERFDAKVQTLEVSDNAYSKDAQTMDITMTVQYQIDTAKVKEIAINYGNLGALANRIRSIAIEKTKGILSSHRAMNDDNDSNGIIENREAVGKEVTDAVTNALNGYYVIVNTVALTNIDFSDAFEATVEQKMIAEQDKLKAQYEAEKRKIEAEAAATVAAIQAKAQVEVAKAQAEAKIEAARGDAEAQKAIADAEAYATQIKVVELARSLGYEVIEIKNEENQEVVGYEVQWGTESQAGKQAILEYLQYLEYLAKWNGELPDVVTGDSGVMITIPGQNKREETK